MGDTETKLLSTKEAAEAVGVTGSTLSRWAAAGAVTPAQRTIGGHMRWNIDQLREQLAARGATTPERGG